MGATIGILASAGFGAFNAIDANQRRQKSKGDAARLAASAPDAKAEQAVANQRALQAQATQRRRTNAASGRSDTILTGPQGASLGAVQRKTATGQ